jgi:hypothetical protein
VSRGCFEDRCHTSTFDYRGTGGSRGPVGAPDVRRALADPNPVRRRQVLHDLFYTPAWPHGPEQSTHLGDRP